MNVHRNAATTAVARKPRKPRQRPAGPVTTTDARKLPAYRHALALCPDEARLRVVDLRTVIVVNSPSLPIPGRRRRAR